MSIEDLRDFGRERGIHLKSQNQIYIEATEEITDRYGYEEEEIKENFDDLIFETEDEAHKLYREYEKGYVSEILDEFAQHLIDTGELQELDDLGEALGKHYGLLDKFFMSLAQGRKARAGGAFEYIQKGLFRQLDYPFTEKPTINGEPDFLMPSADHFRENPMDCVIFTVKRTLRERWRQIVTEGSQGLQFFLGTIDEGISDNALEEMIDHRIYAVIPEPIRQETYPDKRAVISFKRFFEDHLDPAIQRWKRRGIVESEEEESS
jgi:hypothetical protein